MNDTDTAADDKAAASAYDFLHDVSNAGPFVHVLLDYIHQEVDDQYAWCLNPVIAAHLLDPIGRRHFGAKWCAQLRDLVTAAIQSMAQMFVVQHDRFVDEIDLTHACPLCHAIGTMSSRLAPGEVIWEVVCSACGGRIAWQEP